MVKSREKGITLVALVITIVVLAIVAGIAIYTGKDTIKKANLEELKSNMFLIKAKAKGLVEEANYKIGLPTASDYADKQASVRQEMYIDTAKMTSASGISIPAGIPQDANLYVVTNDTLSYWGVGNIELEEGEIYLVKLDDVNATVEVYNTLGYDGKYSLTDIDKIEE